MTVEWYCAIGWDVRIVSSNHDKSMPNLQEYSLRKIGITFVEPPLPVTIGCNVWIGDCAIVLPGVTVGDGAVIGAGSVITRDVPPFAVAAGVPARVRRFRFAEEMRQQLTEIAGCNWPREKIARKRRFFTLGLSGPNLVLRHYVEYVGGAAGWCQGEAGSMNLTVSTA